MVNGMKHTEIGDIPKNWQVQTFEETFRVLPNNTLPRADLNNIGGSVRNVHYGDILVRFPEVLNCKTEDIPYLNDAALITANAQFLQDGDVLLADTAEDETVGKATEIYGLGDGKMVAGLHTIPCRVKKGDFAPKWLGYYMNSHAYHNQIMPYVTGIKVSSISKSAIAETLVLVPPKQEQEAIVAALSNIDMLITNLEKLVAKYQMIKQGCLEKMFPRNGQNEPEIRLPGFSGAWEKRELIKEVSSIDTGKSKFTISESGAYEILGSTSVIGYDDSYDYDGDFILTARVGANAGELYRHSGKVKISDNTVFIQGKQLDFIFYTLQNFDIKKLSFGTGQPLVKASELKEQKITMPVSENERKQIGTYFTVLDNLITLHQRKLEKYKMIKQGMMSELLTGKTRLI